MSKTAFAANNIWGDGMKKSTKQSVKLFFKSAFLTALGLLVIVIGFMAAEYFFG